MSPTKKFGPDRFCRFDVYWIQTNKQTDKPNLYIDNNRIFVIPDQREIFLGYRYKSDMPFYYLTSDWNQMYSPLIIILTHTLYIVIHGNFPREGGVLVCFKKREKWKCKSIFEDIFQEHRVENIPLTYLMINRV